MEKKQFENKDRDLLREVFNEDQIMALKRGNTPEARRGMNWSDKTIETALQLKFLCKESGYELLIKNKIPLPSLRTLNRRIESLKLSPGILDEFFQLLKVKVQEMKAHHKFCSLAFDEMSLVEGQRFDVGLSTILGPVTFPDSTFGEKCAKKALVFMVGGVAGRWKQIIAYYFTTSSTDPIKFKEIILTLIKKCEEIGLFVTSITSDQAGGNQAVWRAFGFGKIPYVNEFVNAIPHPINPEKKLYLFSDAPHAFKNLCQSLLNNQIIVLPPEFVNDNSLSSNVVEKEHFTILLEHQEKSSLKIAPKLKVANLNPQGFEKMRVVSSTNLLNKDVGAALSFLAQSGSSDDLRTTATFVTVIDKWFEIVSSRNYATSLSVSNSTEKITFLESCIELFLKMKIGERGYWKPCQTALILTTKSCIDVYKDLVENAGYTFVMCGRFSQDCVENLFSSIRARSPKTTAFSFKTAIKSISVSLYLKTADGNYQEDDRNYLSFLEQIRQVHYF